MTSSEVQEGQILEFCALYHESDSCRTRDLRDGSGKLGIGAKLQCNPRKGMDRHGSQPLTRVFPVQESGEACGSVGALNSG